MAFETLACDAEDEVHLAEEVKLCWISSSVCSRDELMTISTLQAYHLTYRTLGAPQEAKIDIFCSLIMNLTIQVGCDRHKLWVSGFYSMCNKTRWLSARRSALQAQSLEKNELLKVRRGTEVSDILSASFRYRHKGSPSADRTDQWHLCPLLALPCDTTASRFRSDTLLERNSTGGFKTDSHGNRSTLQSGRTSIRSVSPRSLTFPRFERFNHENANIGEIHIPLRAQFSFQGNRENTLQVHHQINCQKRCDRQVSIRAVTSTNASGHFQPKVVPYVRCRICNSPAPRPRQPTTQGQRVACVSRLYERGNLSSFL